MGNIAHPNHVASILGDLVKKWCVINPDAVRALEKFNRENNNVLLKEGDEKREILTLIRLKAFKGTASGQRIDLSVYRQVFEPLKEEALEQEGTLKP